MEQFNIKNFLIAEKTKCQERIDAIEVLLKHYDESPTSTEAKIIVKKDDDLPQALPDDIRAYIDLMEDYFTIDNLYEEFGKHNRTRIYNTINDYVKKGKIIKSKLGNGQKNVYKRADLAK